MGRIARTVAAVVCIVMAGAGPPPTTSRDQVVGGGPAPAMTMGNDLPPAQLAGLFVQGCMAFAGQPADLRAWATTNGLPALPEPATKAFLHGAPGRAFDASVPDTKLALLSSDDGICSAVTDKGTTDATTQALEAALTQAGVQFRLAIDRDDTRDKALHFREYLATRNGRSWRILAATVHDPAGGQAMLTAAPE